ERVVPDPDARLPRGTSARQRVKDKGVLRPPSPRSGGRRPSRRTAKPRKTPMGIAQPRNLASALRLNPLNEKVLWRLNRLRTMSPAEIRHRVVQAAHTSAERWGFA